MTDHYENLTSEALELLETRKQLPKKFVAQLTEQGMKFCAECQTVQVLDQFRLSATSKSGRAGRCFTCHPPKVEVSQRDFSTDPSEFTLARSLARLRRQSRRAGYPVDVFGVTELMAYWGNPPREEVPEVTLISPERGFKLDNLLPLITITDEEEN